MDFKNAIGAGTFTGAAGSGALGRSSGGIVASAGFGAVGRVISFAADLTESRLAGWMRAIFSVEKAICALTRG